MGDSNRSYSTSSSSYCTPPPSTSTDSVEREWARMPQQDSAGSEPSVGSISYNIMDENSSEKDVDESTSHNIPDENSTKCISVTMVPPQQLGIVPSEKPETEQIDATDRCDKKNYTTGPLNDSVDGDIRDSGPVNDSDDGDNGDSVTVNNSDDGDNRDSDVKYVNVENDPAYMKGQKVCKAFGRKKYMGEVVGYDVAHRWFKVLYEDGDEEDLDREELDAVLIPPDGTPCSSSRKRPLSSISLKGKSKRKI